MKWRVTELRGGSEEVRPGKVGSTTVLTTTAAYVQLRRVDAPRSIKPNESLTIYLSKSGWVGYYSKDGNVSDRIGQDRLEEIHAVANAALALTGDLSKLPLYDIAL